MRKLAPLALFVGLLAFAAPAGAATFQVTGTGDAGSCTSSPCPSIRAALAAAALPSNPGPDTILVPAGTFQLSQGQLTVDSDVTIRGAGARSTRIVGITDFNGVNARVFQVMAGVTATISNLTMADGDETCCDPGGNLLNSGGDVTLDHVRVTGGNAGEGAGLANSTGTMSVLNSLIDNNDADTSTDDSRHGGGILNLGGDVTVRDSTVAFNIGGDGAGIYGVAGSTTTLDRVTVAFNTALPIANVGGIAFEDQAGSLTVGDSIVFGNVADPGNGPIPSNCPAQPVTSTGGNVLTPNDCNLVGPGDVTADPLLGASLVNRGGQTDMLEIASNSPARDHVAGCTGTDQRDNARPQGGACDSGAYEFNVAPDTRLTRVGLRFTFSSTEAGSRFECRLAGPTTFAPCTSPRTLTGLPPGTYTFVVRAIDPFGAPDPTPASSTFTIAAPPNPQPQPEDPEPEAGDHVVIGTLKGTVLVKEPGGTFEPLGDAEEIPLGATVNTKKGRVRLSFQPKKGGKTQTAVFYAGIFRLKQIRTILQLTLTEKIQKCAGGNGASIARKRARRRRLWGNGKGRFRTRGEFSSATVRGTKWLVEDRCDRTLTRVVRGKVAVRDFVKRKTIIVRAGEKYVAKKTP